MRKYAVILGISLLLMLAICVSASADRDQSGDWEYGLLDDGTAKIMKYYGSEKDLVIPETIDGYTVSTLYQYFCNTGCIEEFTSISIPNTLTDIEACAFERTTALTDIIVAKDHPTLAFIDGVLYNKERKSILLYLISNTAEHFDIPEGIKLIEEAAFFRSKLVSVNVPGSVETIEREAFNQSNNLSEINLSEGVKYIGNAAIFNDDALEQITFPASVEYIGAKNLDVHHLKEIHVDPGNPVFAVVDGALINLRDGVVIAFPQESEIESCTIPEGVVTIGSEAFSGAENLKQIVFPESLQLIEFYGVANIDNLTEIILPDHAQLDGFAVHSCGNVQTLHIPADITIIGHNFNGLPITELDIPNGVTIINDSFNNLKNVTDIVIPDSVTTIDSNSFSYCKKLASITIPASVTEIGDPEYMFHDNAENFVIKVAPGSYAEQYCKENKFRYEYIDGEDASAAADDDPFSWLNND